MFSHFRKEFRSKYQTNLLSKAHIGNNPWRHPSSLSFDWNWDWASIVSSESWMFRNVCDSVKTLWFECYQSDCKSVNKACPAHLSDLFVLETSSINTQHLTINIVPDISEDSDSSEVNVVKVEVMIKGSLRESWWPLGDFFGTTWWPICDHLVTFLGSLWFPLWSREAWGTLWSTKKATLDQEAMELLTLMHKACNQRW